MPGVEIKVLDEEGNECPPGVVGAICVRPEGGDAATVEYYGNPEASAKKIQRGWHRSGDMRHSDGDGWLFFDYRAGVTGVMTGVAACDFFLRTATRLS